MEEIIRESKNEKLLKINEKILDVNEFLMDRINDQMKEVSSICFLGSFFIMKDVRTAIGIDEAKDDVELNESVIPKQSNI